jgi:hypothetical protein
MLKEREKKIKKMLFPMIFRLAVLRRSAGNAGYFVVTKASVLGFVRPSIHLKTNVMAYG